MLRFGESVQWLCDTATLLWVQRPGVRRVSYTDSKLMLMMSPCDRLSPSNDWVILQPCCGFRGLEKGE